MNKKNIILSLLIAFSGILTAYSQPQVLDQVAAVVGNKIVLQSHIQSQIQQYKTQGTELPPDANCAILEEMLFQKLLLHHAEIDSITVSESQVDQELDRRLRYFIAQIGSEKALEEYYGKTIEEIKDDFKDLIKDQLQVQTMQGKITDNATVTPAEVKAFFKKFPEDSLPLINAEVEVAHILATPKISEEARKEAREKIETLRERVLKGEKLATLAVLYSEDPGSAKKSGELGMVGRGSFVPEFEAVAFNLKPGEVSKVIETTYGYHILELIERRGEQINVRHILISPKVSAQDLFRARTYLDSVYVVMQSTDTLTFADAALKFSDDKESKNNGGMLINPATGTTKFEMDQVDPQVFFVIDKLKPGEFSQPALVQLPGGKQGYRILYLKSRTEPHRANLKDDYQKIQEAALAEKQQQIMDKWIAKKLESTYFRIADDYKTCELENFKQNVE